MTHFADDLRFCREAMGLSLSAAARLAGITKAHLHDMESGRARNPCVSTLAGLAKAYGQPLGWMAERAALSLGDAEPTGHCTGGRNHGQLGPGKPSNPGNPK